MPSGRAATELFDHDSAVSDRRGRAMSNNQGPWKRNGCSATDRSVEDEAANLSCPASEHIPSLIEVAMAADRYEKVLFIPSSSRRRDLLAFLRVNYKSRGQAGYGDNSKHIKVNAPNSIVELH